jgi:LEA14-like dessication related protein
MKKIIIALSIGVFFIINILAAAFIFLDIQALQFPQTTIRIDVIEINSEEILLRHELQIHNPNQFDLLFKDVQILATTSTGDTVTRLTVEGGLIPAQANRSFSATDSITLKGNISELLTSTVTGTVGIKFLGIIQKTIPLEITVLTSLKEALKQIALPTVTVRADFGTITRNDIEITTEIDVTNPNPFNLALNGITLNIATEIGKNVGNFTIVGAPLPAEHTTTVNGQGTILLEALNAKKLFITLTAEAGATIAGINKTLPFSSTIELSIPNLNEFIPSDKPLELALKVDLQRAKGGLQGNMTLEVINPTKIPLLARDIVVDYYRVKNNARLFIAEGVLGAGELTPENTTLFHGDILLPWSKLFNFSRQGILPDMIFAQLRANISFVGVNQSLPVALGSYIDLQPLRPST